MKSELWFWDYDYDNYNEFSWKWTSVWSILERKTYMDLNLIGRPKLVLIGYLQTKLTVAASTWGSPQFSGLRQAMRTEGLSSLDRWPRVLINNKTDCENDGTETHKAFKKLNYHFLQECNKESTFLLLHVRYTFNIKPHV